LWRKIFIPEETYKVVKRLMIYLEKEKDLYSRKKKIFILLWKKIFIPEETYKDVKRLMIYLEKD